MLSVDSKAHFRLNSWLSDISELHCLRLELVLLLFVGLFLLLFVCLLLLFVCLFFVVACAFVVVVVVLGGVCFIVCLFVVLFCLFFERQMKGRCIHDYG